MIRGASHYLLSFDGLSKKLENVSKKTLGTTRFGQSPVASVTAYASLHLKNVSPVDVSRFNDEAIAGSLEGCGNSLGQSLKSSRKWRNVYSAVANVGPDESIAMTDGQSKGVEFSLVQEAREATQLLQSRTEELRQAIVNADYEVKPTPYTPVEGVEAIQFYLTCAMLIVAFWVGNYWAPNLIFKNTVFREGEGNLDEFTAPFGDPSEDSQQGPADGFDSSRKKTVESQTSSNEKVVVGFGQGSEQVSKKNRRS